MLFDMQNDPLETTNIINDKPQVASALYKKLKDKFNNLRADEKSYSAPVFIVGGNNLVSVVNGFGPANTYGNVISKAHHLTGLKAKGDGADYLLNVLTANDYDVYLKQDNVNGAGISVI